MPDDILELAQAFDDAVLHGDADQLDALLADDFLSIGEQGVQLSRREWTGRHRGTSGRLSESLDIAGPSPRS